MTADDARHVGWLDNAPAMLRDAAGPDGEPCATRMDRRWLWRLEMFLAVHGTTDEQRQMGRDLRQYLNETCEHEWRSYEAEDPIPAHRQCLFCCDVEFTEAAR